MDFDEPDWDAVREVADYDDALLDVMDMDPWEVRNLCRLLLHYAGKECE